MKTFFVGIVIFSFFGNLTSLFAETTNPRCFDTEVVSASVVEIINYRLSEICSDLDVVIPGTINEKSVVSIGYHAFSYKGLVSVVIPDSVITIGSSAFSGNSIERIDFGNGLRHIGPSAFSYNSLTKIEFPENVRIIGQASFHANQLIKVIIGDGVEEIESFAFYNNSIDNIEFGNRLKSIGWQSFAFNKLTNLVIPDNVRVIYEGAFRAKLFDNSSNNISSITIGKDVDIKGGPNPFWRTMGSNSSRFEVFYPRDMNRAAGKYVFESGSWRLHTRL